MESNEQEISSMRIFKPSKWFSSSESKKKAKVEELCKRIVIQDEKLVKLEGENKVAKEQFRLAVAKLDMQDNFLRSKDAEIAQLKSRLANMEKVSKERFNADVKLMGERDAAKQLLESATRARDFAEVSNGNFFRDFESKDRELADVRRDRDALLLTNERLVVDMNQQKALVEAAIKERDAAQNMVGTYRAFVLAETKNIIEALKVILGDEDLIRLTVDQSILNDHVQDWI
jgi:hypothetical protein